MSSGRVGPAALEQLRGELLKRDVQVLQTVADFKIASSRQLERLHFDSDNRSALSSARMARRSLERLARLRLLVRMERRIGGLRAGSSSFLYGLGPVGQRLLDRDGPRRRYREPSAGFVEHTLAITELYVQLVVGDRRGAFELLEASPEPRCWRSFSSSAGLVSLRPDLFVRLGVDEDELLSFVELDQRTEHRPAIERKASVYEAYRRSGSEERNHGVFPRVVWLASSDRRIEQLRVILSRRPDPDLYVVAGVEVGTVVLAGGTP